MLYLSAEHLSLFQISSFDSYEQSVPKISNFFLKRLIKIGFIEQILDIFSVRIDFMLARFDRYARYNNGLRLFMLNSMVFFDIFLRRLLKICIKIK